MTYYPQLYKYGYVVVMDVIVSPAHSYAEAPTCNITVGGYRAFKEVTKVK